MTKFYAGQITNVLKLYEKQENTFTEHQKKLIKTLYHLQDDVKNGKLLLSKITEVFNRELPESVQLTSQHIGSMLRNDFGLETKKSSGNRSVLIWDLEKIEIILSKGNFSN